MFLNHVKLERTAVFIKCIAHRKLNLKLMVLPASNSLKDLELVETEAFL